MNTENPVKIKKNKPCRCNLGQSFTDRIIVAVSIDKILNILHTTKALTKGSNTFCRK